MALFSRRVVGVWERFLQPAKELDHHMAGSAVMLDEQLTTVALHLSYTTLVKVREIGIYQVKTRAIQPFSGSWTPCPAEMLPPRPTTVIGSPAQRGSFGLLQDLSASFFKYRSPALSR